MKRLIFLFLFCMIVLTAPVASTSVKDDGKIVKPFREWPVWPAVEDVGWSSEALETAHAYYESIDSASVMVIYKGKVLLSWGDATTEYLTHSARKSFCSALFGIVAAEGTIDLDRTMAELGIDDEPPLTDQEKTATIRHCLQARSGVYHTAAAETDGMHNYKPARDTYLPGTYWVYNNWDFNVLCTIFNQETGSDFYEELVNRIAVPIGMQDFSIEDTAYFYQTDRSIHPAYHFQISARDCARFGLLFLQNGRWGDEQVIPADWVALSTSTVSDSGTYIPGTGYGYMWWTFPRGYSLQYDFTRLDNYTFYAALGAGTQVIAVVPELDLVYVHRVNTYGGGNSVTTPDSLKLLDLILTARRKTTIDLDNEKILCSNKNLHPGSKMKIKSVIRNGDKSPSRAGALTLWLSRNKKVDAGDTLLSTVDVPTIAPGKRKRIRSAVTLPEDIKPKGYYVISVLDADGVNLDTDTSDNIAISARIIVRAERKNNPSQ